MKPPGHKEERPDHGGQDQVGKTPVSQQDYRETDEGPQHGHDRSVAAVFAAVLVIVVDHSINLGEIKIGVPPVFASLVDVVDGISTRRTYVIVYGRL